MGLRGGERRILSVIENDLRVSDPQLVLAFAAFGSNTRKANAPGSGRRNRLRAMLGSVWRRRRGAAQDGDSLSRPDAPRRYGRPRSWAGMFVFIPLALLAMLSVLVVISPVPRQGHCGFIPSVPAAGAARLGRCLPASRTPHRPLHRSHTIEGARDAPQPAQNAAQARAPVATGQ